MGEPRLPLFVVLKEMGLLREKGKLRNPSSLDCNFWILFFTSRKVSPPRQRCILFNKFNFKEQISVYFYAKIWYVNNEGIQVVI